MFAVNKFATTFFSKSKIIWQIQTEYDFNASESKVIRKTLMGTKTEEEARFLLKNARKNVLDKNEINKGL